MSIVSFDEYYDHDFSFMRNWDNKITTEIAIYNSDIADLRELCQKPTCIDFLLVPDNVDDSLGEVHSVEEKELIQTQILQDLDETIEEVKADRKNIRYKPITDDILIIQQWEENKEEYYTKRIYEHAEEICTHIEGLIQLDDYPEEKFGKFNEIREQIFREHDTVYASKLLGQLLMIGKSAIPAQMRTTEVQIIEPAIGGTKVRTTEQA